jgi:hypothetical protein
LGLWLSIWLGAVNRPGAPDKNRIYQQPTLSQMQAHWPKDKPYFEGFVAAVTAGLDAAARALT